MTRSEFQSYLLAVAALAFVLGAVNLARPHKRWLGGGSILLGFAALLYRYETPTPVVAVVGALAVLCLAKDVSARGRQA